MDKRIKAVAGAFLLTVAFLVLSLSGHIAQAQRSALHSSATPAPLPLSRGNFFGKHYIDPRYGCYIAGILYQNGINFLVPFDSAKEASFINLNTRALPHPYNALVFYLGVDIGSDVQANFRIIEDGLLYRTIHVTGQQSEQRVVVPFSGHTIIKFVVDHISGGSPTSSLICMGNPTAVVVGSSEAPTRPALVLPGLGALVSGTTIPLQWKGVSSAHAYAIQVWLTKAEAGQTIGVTTVFNAAAQATATQYGFPTKGMLKGTYAWRVAAISATGQFIGDWSPPGTFVLQ